MFRAYGAFVNTLGGAFIAAEDVGTNPHDMLDISKETRWVTCLPQTHGGSGNPSPFTARGVMEATKAAWRFLNGKPLRNARVLVQGAGNCGSHIIRSLASEGAKVFAFDLDPGKIAELQEKYPDIEAVASQELYDLDVDIYMPCAVGGVLNTETIPRLKATLVVGAANNQLQDPIKDELRLAERGILYVPDFLANRTGIINCANELFGYNSDDAIASIQKMAEDIGNLLFQAQEMGITPGEAARQEAEHKMAFKHPIFPGRWEKALSKLARR